MNCIENSGDDICLSPDIQMVFDMLHNFMFDMVYTNPICKSEEAKADVDTGMYFKLDKLSRSDNETKALIKDCTEELKKLSFTVLDSKSNFLFAKTEKMGGKELYLALKEKGILVRHFDKEPLCQFNRITIGSYDQMNILIDKIKGILEEEK